MLKHYVWRRSRRRTTFCCMGSSRKSGSGPSAGPSRIPPSSRRNKRKGGYSSSQPAAKQAFHSRRIEQKGHYSKFNHRIYKSSNQIQTQKSEKNVCFFPPFLPFPPFLFPPFTLPLQSAILASLLIKFPSGKTILCDVIRHLSRVFLNLPSPVQVWISASQGK